MSTTRTTVKSVTDGDTFDTTDGRIIRLANVDTPEKGEPGYAEAKKRLTDLIGGQAVTIKQNAIDVYKRVVADVWRVSDCLYINEQMKKHSN